MDTNDINERLQRSEDRALAAEMAVKGDSMSLNNYEALKRVQAKKIEEAQARSLASEMALADILTTYELWRVTDNTQQTTIDRMRAIGKIADEVDLTAAREVMRKAAAYDTELPEMDKSLSLCRKRCESMKTLEGLSLDELNMRLTHRAEQVDALRAERDELAALVEKVRSLDYDCVSHVDKRAWIPNEIWDANAPASALADLKARIKREVLEEAADTVLEKSNELPVSTPWQIESTLREIAAELRRIAKRESR
jgi:hypothetical protein